MNSTAGQRVNTNATAALRILVLPTQHSITRSRVSFAHVTSSGNNSRSSRRGSGEEREDKCMSSRRSRVTRRSQQTEGNALKKMGGRWGNEISDEDGRYLESFLPQSLWAKTNRHHLGHRVPLCRTWLRACNRCNTGAVDRRGSQKRGGSIIIRTESTSL